MSVANRAIKAKPDALPDYLSENLSNAKVVRQSGVEDNDMVHLAPSDELDLSGLPSSPFSVPLSFWKEHKQALLERGGPIAVQLAGVELAEELVDELEQIDMVVLPFVNFVDGRNYSDAYKLRTRLGFTGEIRAVGDVHHDQLGFLARVGVNAFELSDDEDHDYALNAFREFSEVYQPSADGQPLIFSRRRKVH